MSLWWWLENSDKNKRDIMTKNSNFCEFMSFLGNLMTFFVKVGRELCAVSPAAVPGNQLGVQNQPRHRQTPDRKEINVFTSLKVRFKLIFYSLFDKKFNWFYWYFFVFLWATVEIELWKKFVTFVFYNSWNSKISAAGTYFFIQILWHHVTINEEPTFRLGIP